MRGKYRLDASDVREAARGQWLHVLSALSGDLEPAINKLGRHVPCPVHGGTNGFRLYKNADETGGGVCNTCTNSRGEHGWYDGISLLMWVNGWDFKTTLTEVAQVLHIHPEGETESAARGPSDAMMRQREEARRKRKLEEAAEIQRKVGNIATVWQEAVPFTDGIPEPVLKYFTHRGVMPRRRSLLVPNDVEVMRFHPSLTYQGQQTFPAIVLPILTAEGELVNLHRIFITEAGQKAPVPSARKQMEVPISGATRGGFIPLGGMPGDVMGVAEGVETAMAAMKATGMPVWSCINSGNLGVFTPPEHVRTVLIWADKDQQGGGQKDAQKLAQRLEAMNIRAHVLLPVGPIPEGQKSVDWNDVMLSQGEAGFPSPQHLRTMTTTRVPV